MNAEKKTVGLIGIGLVGTVVAEQLLAGGHAVLGYDIDRAQCDRLPALGGHAADSPREVAEAVDCVLLSLPDTGVVRQVVEGADGVLSARRIPSTVIDTTTGDPNETVAVADTLRQRGSSLLEATICGSSRQLQEREAILMVGGDRSVFDACKDLLGMLADRIFYVGPSGSG